MSWQTVLKAELLPPKLKLKVKPKTEVSNTTVDTNQCCEDFFESINIWMHQNKIAVSRKWPPDYDNPIQDIRELVKNCASLKRYINSAIHTLRQDDIPSIANPSLAKDELKHILEVWEKCDAGDIGSSDFI